MKRDRHGTARDILTEIEQLHRDLSAYYTRLRDAANDERQQMLIDYLVEREEEQASMLHRTLEDRADDASLGTWETSAETVSAESVLTVATDGADTASVAGLTELAHRIDNRLAEYYESLVRESRIAELQELFSNLHQYQQQRTQQLQMAVDRFGDI